MFFHVILTTQCKSECRYCFGEAIEDIDEDFSDSDVDYSLPRTLDYDISMLDRFCRFDSDSILTFYGGEPLLCLDKIKLIMDNVKAKHFMIQTNGLLLDQLEPEYVNRFHTILVSVDGDESLTDFYRGKGTFRKVVDNLRHIVQNGFRGELIARMTVMEQTDIYSQARWLLENDEFNFSSVHWQLNAGFWKNDFGRRDFRRWSEDDYNPGVRRLVKFWVDYMQQNGIVLRLYPILGVTHSILHNEDSQLRCGGGWINYAIQTDGYIVPCPTMWGMKKYYVDHIATANPLKLKQVFVSEPCTGCTMLRTCGGRCLYSNITRRWSDEAYNLVCTTVKNLVDSVEKEIPRIKRLIETEKVKEKDFDFLKYNGCEIIP